MVQFHSSTGLFGLFVYRLGHKIFILGRAVRFCYRLPIVLWCNGSTTDFGSVCLGSNPDRTTNSLEQVMDVMIPYTLVILQIWYTDVVYCQSNFPPGLG